MVNKILIGMTCPCLHQQISIYGQQNGLMIIETRFGPTLVGKTPNGSYGNYECGIFNLGRISVAEEENNILKTMEAETAGIKKIRAAVAQWLSASNIFRQLC